MTGNHPFVLGCAGTLKETVAWFDIYYRQMESEDEDPGQAAYLSDPRVAWAGVNRNTRRRTPATSSKVGIGVTRTAR